MSAVDSAKKRVITLSFSPAALAGGVITLCAGFVLVFALGVLLGRGHNLNENIPELDRLMPEPAQSAPPTVIAPGESGYPEGVINQADLEYRDHLKKPSRPAAPQKPKSKPVEAKANAPVSTQKLPPGMTTAGAAAPKKQQKPAAPEKSNAAEAKKPVPSGDSQRYNYVYQVASYKEKAACDAYTAKLKAAGYKARTDKSESGDAVWYRTVIDFTGKPDDTDALREGLKKYGVARAILKMKTPVK